MTDPLTLVLAALGGAFLGSIPFGLLVTRAAGLGDIRAIGSGNIGATNVLRTGRRDLALATLVLDGAKGAVALLLARAWAGETAGLVAGFAAFLGHLYPVWLGFRGGKGVATALGTLIAAAWPVGAAACAAWLVGARLSRISSVGALAAIAAAPVAALLLGRTEVALFAAALAVLVVHKHRPNIARLRAGTEPRIGAGKATPPA